MSVRYVEVRNCHLLSHHNEALIMELRKWREDPDGEANTEATRANRREVFALKMQAITDAEDEILLCAWCDNERGPGSEFCSRSCREGHKADHEADMREEARYEDRS